MAMVAIEKNVCPVCGKGDRNIAGKTILKRTIYAHDDIGGNRVFTVEIECYECGKKRYGEVS